MKTMLLTIAAFALVVPTAMAQERAAGGTLENQMTWAALSSQIDNLKTQLGAANTRIDQVVVCGRKGMLYAPGGAGADPQGCLLATTKAPVTPPASTRTETKTFTETLNNPYNTKVTIPNTYTYCQNKGYDTSYASSLIQHQETHHCGGSTGGDCTNTITTGYTISCIRSVSN